MSKHKRTPSTSTSTTTSSHSRPLTSASHHPLLSLLHLLLRSAALLSILAVALLLALAGWAVLRRATRVPQVEGRERVWLQYGESKPPYATLDLDPRRYGAIGGQQRYDLSVELSVPVNENNVELGNFMVSLALVDGEGERVVNVSRPAILAHPSFSSPSPSRSSSSSPSLLSFLNPLNILRLPFSFLSPSPTSSSLSPSLRLCTQKTQTLVVPLLEGVSLSSPPAPRKRGWGRRRVTYGAGAGSGRVESLWIEVGRRDAHGADFDKPQRELQVYESYLRVETKLRGLRSIIHSHPLLSFTLFFPSFLLLELVAALLVYTAYVLKLDSTFGLPPPFGKGEGEGERAAEEVVGAAVGRVKKEEEEGEETLTEGERGGSATTEEEDQDVKPLLSPSSSPRSDLPSSSSSFSPTSISGSGDEGLDSEYAEQERMRRMRLGKGGRGMSEVAPPSSGEEYEEGEEEYEEEVEEEAGREGKEGIEGVEEALAVGQEKDEGDETATVGGSETTARTRSTFGPMSVATGTTLSSTSSGGSGLRSRGNGGGTGGGAGEE